MVFVWFLVAILVLAIVLLLLEIIARQRREEALWQELRAAQRRAEEGRIARHIAEGLYYSTIEEVWGVQRMDLNDFSNLRRLGRTRVPNFVARGISADMSTWTGILVY
jgi:heme exporter protein D